MKMVRFGAKVVNMDLVTDMQIERDRAVLFFAVASDNGYDTITRDVVVLVGADIIALEGWVDENSENAREPMLTEADL